MCRNIKPLFNFEPPANDDEIRAAAIQFVNKISGTSKPSIANQPCYDRAVEDISAVVDTLLNSLTTTAHPRNREAEAKKAQLRAAKRFPKPA